MYFSSPMLHRKLTHQGTPSNASMRSLSFTHGAADDADEAPAQRSWVQKWFCFDALLQLANTYYASRMALVTITACLSMLFLSLFSTDEDGFGFWMGFQMTNTLLGASALPGVCLYTVVSMQPSDEQDETVPTSLDDALSSPPRDDRHTPVTSFALLRPSFRNIETRIQPFVLKRSKMLKLCEIMVVIQLVQLCLTIIFAILIFWMMGQPVWEAFMFAVGDGLGLLAIVCVLLQTREFDRLRAHEQLQLGVGLDQDQLDYATSFKKRPPSSGRIITVLSPEASHDSTRSAHVPGHVGATPDHTSITLDLGHSSWVVEYKLRRGLFEAAVNRDHDKARALLDVMERVLESKMKLELYLLNMYATPTLWFWSFAYTTHNPLHVACRLGDDVMVEILLKGGIHPDLLDKTQGAPFSFYEVCQGRGKSSANVLASPLHVAVTHGHTNVIDMLVAHKANINIVAQTSFFSQSQRVPPIFLADSADVIERLIRHRANFLVVPGKGNNMTVTVLQRAMLNDRSELENVLKEWGADVALTPLHEASAMGDLPTVKHYLSLGIPPDQLGEYHDGVHRRTPLHWASIMGRHAVATELLAHKADVHALDARFRSPLHWAARHCHVETVEVLLQAGANPLQCDADGLTPLAFSATGGLLNGPCVELFHLYGVDINAQLPTATGDTCLHLALREGHQEAALALIQHGGARLASYNALGEPAIKCCASAEQLYAIKLSSHWVDIVISYDSVYRQLAEHLKQGIEESYLTVSMRDAHAGSAQHSMDAMRRASAVVCVLTPGFERNPICMEELAFAKEHHVPVMAITIATMNLPEELQVYLFTRQLVPFRDAILASRRSSVPSPGGDETRELRFKLDDAKFKRSLQNLIDGLRDEVELHALGLARAVGGSETGDHDDHDETARSRSLYFLRTGTGIDTASISDMGGERSRATSSPRTNRGGLFVGSNAKRRTLNDVVRDVLSRRRRSVVLPSGSRHPLQRTSVFLSHGDCHAEFVAKLQQKLRQHEVPVTLDSISQVASMKERILAAKDAILQCDIFLVVLSEKSVKTELVSDQLAFAEDKGKHIVPIYYTRRPGLVDSTVKQLLEALDRPMRIFGNGISYGRGFDELLEELRHEEELELQRQQDEMDGREWVPVSPAARQAVDLLLGGHLPGGSVLV